MSKNLEILTIDFDETVIEDFEASLEETFSSLSVTHLESGKENNSSKDFDIVFLFIDGNKDPQRKVSNFRAKLPLSEIILVTNTEDFTLALFSLRNGVRDIIAFPFDEEELNLSIKSAYSYRFTYFQSNRLSQMIGMNNHFGNLRELKSYKDLFQKVLNLFLTESPEVKLSIFEKDLDTKVIESVYPKIADDQNTSSFLERFKEIDNFMKEIRFFNDDSTYCHEFSKDEDKKYFFLLSNFNSSKILSDENIRDYFFTVLRNSFQFVTKSIKQKEMTSLAHTDDVTGLYNQRKLYKDIDKNILLADQKKESFSLVFLDLDNFKNVNDGHGHLVGTNLLLQVAQVIRQVIRDTDYIYRYGGDEFVIILPTAKAENAKRIGERLLSIIKGHDFKGDDEQVFSLSLSIGIAEYPRDAQDRHSILKIADKMMYEAKKTGRGRVCLIDEIFKNKPDLESRSS